MALARARRAEEVQRFDAVDELLLASAMMRWRSKNGWNEKSKLSRGF
ncbi:hypothetical protein [Salipiger mangrovisoli]|nr:hypothetical protein [Salipiger mangrovisoli]